MLGFKSEHKAIYFAEKAEDAMDKLWDEGLWDDEKNEKILKQHLRTPYNA